MAGDHDQIQTVIDNNIVPKLICSMRDHDTWVRNKTTQAITNATSCGSDAQMRYLILDQRCIDSFCELLNGEEVENIICIALEGLESIFKIGGNEANERSLWLHRQC